MELSSRQPSLKISQSTLIFTQATVDKPCYLLLTVAQQYADSPVTIETDSPDHFLLATDDQPIYKPKLTFVPSPEGTYVHVRYMSSQRATIQALLTVQSPYATQTVALKGRTAGLLAVVQKAIPTRNLPQLASGTEPHTRKRWIALGLVAVLSGLGYAGVMYRCEIFPGLCQPTSVSESTVEQSPALPTDSLTINLADDAPSSGKRPSVEGTTSQPTAKAVAESDISPKAVTQQKETKAVNRQKSDSTVLDQESDLERELNGKPGTN
ncbi:hypothetical protein [Spirosoma fluviale]|uniref:Uncharacterized protein n=1 Tax=Spirosoma fluviale TaxID=1597977 RepID=A0A286G9Z7_9BACT|nr:hypothetical protein [Spirosoma fluviale]SOD92056.1 hypothetical protein SAMN06269250_3775 [Spirosoma fluviale]